MNTQKSAGSDLASIVLNEMKNEEIVAKEYGPQPIELPSAFQVKQVVLLAFRVGDPALTATVCGVHFYIGKVKYDLTIWLDDDQETRIYNVDSVFVSPA